MHRDENHHQHGHHLCRRFARGERPFGGMFRGHREGHEHRGGGRRLGRLFEHGDLRFVVLQLIADKPRYGYQIIKAIEDKVGGAYSPSPGVIYPTLTLLEELGYVTVEATADGKKLHHITEAGTAYLAANQAAVEAIFKRMGEVNAAHGGGPSPQLLRAMENLKLALRLRLASGPLSDEQIRAIAAAIDAAATAVEQV